MNPDARLDLTVRPVEPADWPDVERLFGDKGACGGCWCMWWRVPHGGKTWQATKGEPARRALRALVQGDAIHAVLARAGDEPVGWCCFGPRVDFPRVGTVRALQRDTGAGTWAIVCFYIPARWRRRGVASALARAATARALALGATEVEAWPVVPEGDQALPAAFSWTGVPALFTAVGFRKLPRPGMTRPIYLLRAPARRGGRR